MREGRRWAAVAATVTFLALTAACADTRAMRPPQQLAGSAALADKRSDPPPVPSAARATQFDLSEDPTAGLPVPSVWRIRITGTVQDNSAETPVDLEGWMLVTHPYDQVGGSLNDVNILDLGITTDRPPTDSEPVAGALWFGTNTSIASDMNLPGIVTGHDVDVVTERREGDVVHADLVTLQAPLREWNLYLVKSGLTAQVSHMLAGTVSVLFAADGSTITGRIDIGGTSGMGSPTVSTEYHAAITGTRHLG